MLFLNHVCTLAFIITFLGLQNFPQPEAQTKPELLFLYVSLIFKTLTSQITIWQRPGPTAECLNIFHNHVHTLIMLIFSPVAPLCQNLFFLGKEKQLHLTPSLCPSKSINCCSQRAQEATILELEKFSNSNLEVSTKPKDGQQRLSRQWWLICFTNWRNWIIQRHGPHKQRENVCQNPSVCCEEICVGMRGSSWFLRSALVKSVDKSMSSVLSLWVTTHWAPYGCRLMSTCTHGHFLLFGGPVLNKDLRSKHKTTTEKRLCS